MEDQTVSLERYLESNNVWFRFVEKEETTHTADASRVTGIPLARITKNLVSKTDGGQFVLLVIPGDRRVNLRRAARVLGAKNVSILPFKDAEEVSGYPTGGTPTVGHKTPMRVIFDSSLLKHETLFCGGGSRNRLLELQTEEALLLAKAVVADITETSSSP